MKNAKKYITYTVILAISVTSIFSCKSKKYSRYDEPGVNKDSLMLVDANRMADSIAKLNAKPDNTPHVDTAKILANPDYAFVHNCIKSNCKQMEVIHFGMVNGFDKKVKLASKKMMGDYAMLNSQLRDYAMRNNIPISNDTTIDLSYTNTMDGYTWDSTWIDLVVRDQTAMLSDFQQAQKVVKDAQLQEMINNHMLAINKHIDVASNLRKTY